MRPFATALLVALALLGASCGSGDTPTAAAVVEVAAATTAAADVELDGFSFEPAVVEIGAGEQVRWTNRDATRHTVTAGASPDPSGAFELPLDGEGAQAALRFKQPGEYRYFCTPHPFMQGVVRVRG